MNTQSIPDDATSSAIKRWIENGSDIEKIMLIDFFIIVPTKEVGEQLFLEKALIEFQKSVELDAETNTWTCYLSKEMFPDYYAIIRIERLLEEISQKINGTYDGFASYGNA